MRPIRTYAVEVYGYDKHLYSARSPGAARAQSWRAFCEFRYQRSFHKFLVNSRVWRVPDPPGIGQRILVAGEPATRVIGHGQYVHFMRDDSDVILLAHPADVAPMPQVAR